MQGVDIKSVSISLERLGFTTPNAEDRSKFNRTTTTTEGEIIDEIEVNDDDDDRISINWVRKIWDNDEAAACLFNGYIDNADDLQSLVQKLNEC